MTFPRIGNPWFIRVGCFLAGFAFAALTPFLWRRAEDIGLALATEPVLSWRIAAGLSLALGFFLMWASIEFSNPWRRLRRFLNSGDNWLLIGTAAAAIALGAFTYFVLNERLAAACWRGPFEWIFVVSCPFFFVLTVIAWAVTVVLGVLVYFGAIHHPIVRLLGDGQRGLLADDTDEYL